MIVFVGCASTALINYSSTFQTCQTVEFIHTANRASNLDENSMLKRKPVEKKKVNAKNLESKEERQKKKAAAAEKEAARLIKAKRKKKDLKEKKIKKQEFDGVQKKQNLLPVLA